MRDEDAEAFEHMSAGLNAVFVSGAPFAGKRDGLGFKDLLAMERLHLWGMAVQVMKTVMAAWQV